MSAWLAGGVGSAAGGVAVGSGYDPAVATGSAGVGGALVSTGSGGVTADASGTVTGSVDSGTVGGVVD